MKQTAQAIACDPMLQSVNADLKRAIESGSLSQSNGEIWQISVELKRYQLLSIALFDKLANGGRGE